MAIPLPVNAVQAQQINQRVKNIDDFSQVEEGLQCFMDQVELEVMVHNPQVLQCGHSFEANTIRRVQEQAEIAILEANRRGERPDEPPTPNCPACRREIAPEYQPIPNVNLRQAIEAIGDRVLPSLQHEQMQKTVYRDALAQDVQQLAGEIVQRNARITTLEGENGVLQTENGQLRTERDAAQGRVQHLEGENGELRTERDVAQVANRTLTEQIDTAQAQRDSAKIQLGMRRVDDLNADIQKASTSISRKGAASFGTVVSSAFGIMAAPMAGGIVAGPPGFIAGLGAAFSGLAVADKIDESQRRTKEEKLQKEQEKLALEAHIRNLRAQQRV